MDFLDYREKLGIGFNDNLKFKYFKTKLFNILRGVCADSALGGLDFNEYFDFCNLTGTKMDSSLTQSYYSEDRMRVCINEIERHTSNLTEFLPYCMAFINSVKTEKCIGFKRIDFINVVTNMLNQSHIPYELFKEDSEYFVFPKGAKELDDALVSETLEWLSDYPKAHTAWVKALKDYSIQTDDTASEIADKFRKALEIFFHEFFSVEKSLENCKKEYGAFLKEHGVPAEISGNFETLLQAYTNYINGFAKHQDKTSRNVLEYILYQTGNIIRLLITLKQEVADDAD